MKLNHKIILIGPIRVGKSTISQLLSKALDYPVQSLDCLRKYYDEIGYDYNLERHCCTNRGTRYVVKWLDYEKNQENQIPSSQLERL